MESWGHLNTVRLRGHTLGESIQGLLKTQGPKLKWEENRTTLQEMMVHATLAARGGVERNDAFLPSDPLPTTAQPGVSSS
jgi:hypothetical protein